MRTRRRWVAVLLVAVVVLGAFLLARQVSGAGWKAEYAGVADRVVAGLEAEHRSAQGNVVCFDVCRRLTSTYVSATPARSTVSEMAERMRERGFIDVGLECDEDVWCSAWGTYDGLGVTVSQYKRGSWAAEHPDLLREVTVVVSMPE